LRRPFARYLPRSVGEVLVGLREGSSAFEDIAARYPLVRFVRLPLQPAGIVRNDLVHRAAGEWVAFLDGDDIWGDSKTEAQLALAERDGLDFVGTDHLLVNEANVSCAHGISVNVPMPSSWLVRREIMSTHQFDDDPIEADVNWWRDYSGGIRAGRLPLPLLRYRVRRISLSSAVARKRNKLFATNVGGISFVIPFMLGGTWLLNRLRRSTRYVWNARDWGPEPVRSE
jgi:hypothetical protein